jgi:hypothetical protein
LAQTILKKQFQGRNGLQSTNALEQGKKWNSTAKDFVQIMSDGTHWVCVSNRRCGPSQVEIYDSLYRGEPSSTVMTQLATIIKTLHPKLTICTIHVQQQEGYNDCGLFAIAFAVAVCYDIDPATLTFQQTAMRNHLRTCLELKKMAPFPVSKSLKYKKVRVRGRAQATIFCLCRSILKEETDGLCQCAKCAAWYHNTCISTINCFEESSSWVCPLCL